MPACLSGFLIILILTLSLLNSDMFCHLLITFAINLDPDQAQNYVWPGLDPNWLSSEGIPERKIDKI